MTELRSDEAAQRVGGWCEPMCRVGVRSRSRAEFLKANAVRNYGCPVTMAKDLPES